MENNYFSVLENSEQWTNAQYNYCETYKVQVIMYHPWHNTKKNDVLSFFDYKCTFSIIDIELKSVKYHKVVTMSQSGTEQRYVISIRVLL